MRAEMPTAVPHLLGDTFQDVMRSLWSLGPLDIVHAHMTAGELPAALLKRRLRARLMVTRHFAAARGSSAPARLAGRYIGLRVDEQIAISRFVAESIDGPSTVLHNGVRPSSAPTASRSESVLVMQRLEREKDTATALRAWSLTGLGSRGWRLTICGRGSQRDDLQRLSRELGVHGTVKFAGFVENPRARLAEAAIMMATAPAEPFGLSVVEAMAEGTPVIAAGGGAHRETLGPDGLFFTPGDAVACAAELLRLAVAPSLRSEVGEHLRRRHAELFTVSRHVDRLIDRYQALLGPGSKP
jgi:glycosyltransferase involved in cell wall biosynthesis